MDKIGWGQLGIVLALSRIFAEAANFPSDDINYGMQRFTVIVLSYILLGIALIPVYILTKNDASVISCSISGKAGAVIMIIYLVMASVSTTTRLQFYTSSTIFDAAPPWILILFVSIVCLYGLFKGIPAVVRTGVIVAALFLFLLMAVIIGVSDHIQPDFLYAAFTDRPSTLLRDVIAEFSKNGELVIFALLCSDVRKNAFRSLYVCLPTALGVQLLMTFLYNTVLGEYLNNTSFPFYMLSALSDISLLQRLDGIDVVVWVMSAVIKISLISLAIYSACTKSFLNKKGARIVAIAALIVSGGASLYFSVNTNDFLNFATILESGIPLITAGFIIPLCNAMFRFLQKKKEERYENS